MADQNQQQNQGNQPAPGDQGEVQQNAEKDPENWATGDEPITGAQLSYLTTLAQEAGVELDTDNMTKAQASEKINELQGATNRQGGTGTESVGGSDS